MARQTLTKLLVRQPHILKLGDDQEPYMSLYQRRRTLLSMDKLGVPIGSVWTGQIYMSADNDFIEPRSRTIPGLLLDLKIMFWFEVLKTEIGLA